MQKILRLEFIANSPDAGLLVLRLVLGVSMLWLHGWDKLMALFADMATGNSTDTEVLEATCCNGSNLFVSDGSKRDAVDKLLNGS